MDRVEAFEAYGWGFESLLARQTETPRRCRHLRRNALAAFGLVVWAAGGLGLPVVEHVSASDDGAAACRSTRRSEWNTQRPTALRTTSGTGEDRWDALAAH